MEVLCYVSGVKLSISTSQLETITHIPVWCSGWKITFRKDKENFFHLFTYSIKVVVYEDVYFIHCISEKN